MKRSLELAPLTRPSLPHIHHYTLPFVSQGLLGCHHTNPEIHTILSLPWPWWVPMMFQGLGVGRGTFHPSPHVIWSKQRDNYKRFLLLSRSSSTCASLSLSPELARSPLSYPLPLSLFSFFLFFFLHRKVILLWRRDQVHGVTSHTPNRELTSITLWNFGFHHFLIFLKGSQHLALTAVVHLESNLKTEKKANDILLPQPCH